MDIGTSVALFGVVVSSSGGLVWAVRQEGRIKTLETLRSEDKEDLKYIRDKVDKIHARVNGHSRSHSEE